MNRYRTYGEDDDQPVSDGDGGWIGVDMRRDPAQLEPGLCALAVNLRFTRGVAEPRQGIRFLAWGSPGEPGGDPGHILPYGDVSGAGVFNDPASGFSWLIVATQTPEVYKARQGTTGSPMPLPAGMAIPARVQILQTYNGLVMLRGEGLNPIYMSNLDAGWQDLPAVTLAGKLAIPPSSNGVYFQNRLFVIYEGDDSGCRDCVFVSDFGATVDTLQGSVAYNAFKINQGSRDSLVALYRFNDTTLLAFKEDSVYFVGNIYGTNEDIAANAYLDAVTTEYGLRAARSVVQVGNDVWFLAHKRGICSVVQTTNQRLQGVDVPVSRDIQPLIDRINWSAADNAVAAAADNKVYFAVPIDGATYNNAVLVYDTLNQRWAGYDTGTSIRVREWIKVTYGGVIRLAFVSDNGFICLYEDGFLDQVPGANPGEVTSESIATTLRTRAYGGSSNGRKVFGSLALDLATWWPSYTVKVLADGVSETRTLASGVTRSRTAYSRPFDRAAWVDSNVNDDHAEPYRGDYAVIIPAGGIHVQGSGVAFDLHQQSDVAYRLRERGQSVQVELTGAQGRTVLNGVKVEAFRGTNRNPVQV